MGHLRRLGALLGNLTLRSPGTGPTLPTRYFSRLTERSDPFIDDETRYDLLMPTYEYRCLKGHEFELFQRMSDAPASECPECGEMSERLLSGGAGFIFKGDGFYITDSRSDEYKKAASSDKENAPSGDKSSGAKNGDSKSSSSSSSSSSPKESSSSGSSSSAKDSSTKSSASN